jgi:hypothetical protein
MTESTQADEIAKLQEYSRHLLGRIKAGSELLRECMGEIGRAKDFKLLEKISMFMVANEHDFTQVTDAEKAYDELFYQGKCMLVNFAKVVGYPDVPNVDTGLPDFFLLKVNAFTKEELQKLRHGNEQKQAEIDMLRGVGCMEDGDGPCGCCVKCMRAQIDSARQALGGFGDPNGPFGGDLTNGINAISMRCAAAEKGLKEYRNAEETKKAKGDSSDPRFKEDGKFWFWDEVWCNKHGPYDTAEQRDNALQSYVDNL